MPIYEYYCPDNHTIYQFFAKTLAQGQTVPKCPDNPKFKLRKLVSAFAVTKGGRKDDSAAPAHAAEGASVTAKGSTFLRSWARTTKTKRTRKVAVGTVKKSTAMSCFVWLARNDRHDGEGGPRSPFGRYFQTVAADT
jgi:hypothetical protein